MAATTYNRMKDTKKQKIRNQIEEIETKITQNNELI